MIWLASGSPRRKQLLEWVGLEVLVRPAYIDEARDPAEHPVAYALRLARTKARSGPATEVVVAADTVVHLDSRVFDKPATREEASDHLRALSNAWHTVTTGVCVRRGDQEDAFEVSTRVQFRALSEDEIAAYLLTGEADDKAGAYGIQGRAGVFVRAVEGSWTNVMGLPVQEVLDALERLRR